MFNASLAALVLSMANVIPLWYHADSILVIGAALFLIITGKAVYDRKALGIILLVSWLVFLSSGVYGVLSSYNILFEYVPFWTSHASFAGAALEMVLFSLALGYRVRRMERDIARERQESKLAELQYAMKLEHA